MRFFTSFCDFPQYVHVSTSAPSPNLATMLASPLSTVVVCQLAAAMGAAVSVALREKMMSSMRP